MMLPSVMPMALTFASISRQRRVQQSPYARTGAFVLGYLAVWCGFSVLATLAQWGMLEVRLVTPMMVSTTPLLGGTPLIIAGAFQLTPLKHAYLRKCTSPLGLLLTEWRDGTLGAWIMGARHGTWCVGCCGLLMAVLFFGVGCGAVYLRNARKDTAANTLDRFRGSAPAGRLGYRCCSSLVRS